MPFRAINTFEEELLAQEQRHTLELRLEEAMRLFQRCLTAQAEKTPDTHALYAELFAVMPGHQEEIEEDNGELLPPAARRLRAMALKNYAVLLLDTSQESELPTLIESISKALELTDGSDMETLELASKVFFNMGWLRLARLGLEAIATSTSASWTTLSILDKSQSRNKKNLLSSHDSLLLDALGAVVEKIDFGECQKNATLFELNQSLSPPEPSKTDHRLEILLMEPTWPTLCSAVLNAVIEEVHNADDKFLAWFRAPHELSMTTSSSGPSEQSSSSASNSSTNEHSSTSGDESKAAIDSSPRQGDSDSDRDSEHKSSDKDEAAPKRLFKEIEDGDGKRHTNAERATKRISLGDRTGHNAEADGEVELLALSADFGSSEDIFCESITRYLSAIPSISREEFPSPATSFVESLQTSTSLMSRLLNWSDREDNDFKSSFPDSNSTDDILQLLETAALPSPSSPSYESFGSHIGDAVEFIERAEGRHILEVLVSLSFELLDRDCGDKLSFKVIDAAEKYIWAQKDAAVTAARAQRLYEVYANRVLAQEQDEDPVHSEKLNRWRYFSRYLACDDTQLQQRHLWISSLVDQAHVPPKCCVERFESVLESLGSISDNSPQDDFHEFEHDFHLPYVPPMSISQAQTQRAKWRAAAVFERVFSSSEPDLLEAMLIPDAATDTNLPEIGAIRTFLNGSSTLFRLKLWMQLLKAHDDLGDWKKARQCLILMVSSNWNASNLRKLSIIKEVGRRLLNALGPICGESFSSTSDDSEDSDNEDTVSIDHDEMNFDASFVPLDGDDARKALPTIVEVLKLLEEFVFYEESVTDNQIRKSSHPNWNLVAKKLRNTVVQWWAIFYIYYRACFRGPNPHEALADLLSIIHERLGRAGICDKADGLIVRLHLSEIAKFGMIDTELDLAQCLHCRYGLTLGLSTAQIANHPRQNIGPPNKILKDEFTALAPILSQMVLAKKSPGVALTRTDLRNVLDTMWEAIGAPPEAETIILRNIADMPITTQLIQSAWVGSLSPITAGNPSEIVPQVGDFYYVVALAQLGQCKVKRRTGTATEEDVSSATIYFAADLTLKPKRTESWLGMAQALGILADLRLGAIPSVSVDAASDACRQQVVASSMALSCLLSSLSPGNLELSKTDRKLKEDVLGQFGLALVSSSLAPLDGLPFTSNPPQRYVLKSSSLAVSRPVPDWRIVLNLGWRALKQSDPFLAAHAAHRLGDTKGALKVLSRGLDDIDTSVYTLEVIISATCKSSDKLTDKEAIRWVRKVASSQRVKVKSLELNSMIIEVLQGILSKTKWLHRPRYLLAKIYWRQNDLHRAEKELGELFSLRSGEPLRIWRTDGEWPGLRSVYMLEYWLYFVDLLGALQDEISLSRIAHRCRRFTAEVYDHQRGWEHTVQTAVEVGRKHFGFEPRYSDRYVSELPADFRENLGVLDHDSPWARALAWAIELRRLNNGYGVTAGVDDLVVCIFLRMWRLGEVPKAGNEEVSGNSRETSVALGAPGSVGGTPVPNTEHDAPQEQPPELPTKEVKKNTKPKRVARKDIIQAAQQIVRSALPKLSKLDDLCIPQEVRLGSSPNAAEGLASPENTPPVSDPPVTAPTVASENIALDKQPEHLPVPDTAASVPSSDKSSGFSIDRPSTGMEFQTNSEKKDQNEGESVGTPQALFISSFPSGDVANTHGTGVTPDKS